MAGPVKTDKPKKLAQTEQGNIKDRSLPSLRVGAFLMSFKIAGS